MSKLPTLLKCAFHDDVRIVPYQRNGLAVSASPNS